MREPMCHLDMAGECMGHHTDSMVCGDCGGFNWHLNLTYFAASSLEVDQVWCHQCETEPERGLITLERWKAETRGGKDARSE